MSSKRRKVYFCADIFRNKVYSHAHRRRVYSRVPVKRGYVDHVPLDVQGLSAQVCGGSAVAELIPSTSGHNRVRFLANAG